MIVLHLISKDFKLVEIVAFLPVVKLMKIVIIFFSRYLSIIVTLKMINNKICFNRRIYQYVYMGTWSLSICNDCVNYDN